MTTMAARSKTDIRYKPVGQFEETRYEKIHNVIFENSNDASIEVAEGDC